MRLLVVFALLLAPAVAFPAQGKTTNTIVKPGRCPSFLERLCKRESDYKGQTGKYYVYEGKHQIEDLSDPSNNQDISHRRVTKRDILAAFEGKSKVDRQETYFDANPVSISYSVTENGISYSWNEKEKKWDESPAFPEMADGMEFIMHQEGIMTTPYQYRALPELTWGSKEYTNVMAIEMGNPELTAPDSQAGKTQRIMTAKSYLSRREGFIGYEARSEVQFTSDSGIFYHTRTLNLETLVEILDKKPAGLTEAGNP